MAAIEVSLASTLFTTLSSSSSSSSSFLFRKLRSTPFLCLSFAVKPLCSLRGNRMAHSLARATLGLTHPAQIEPPKISFSAKLIDLVEWKGDILAVGVTEKDMVKDGNLKFQNSILKKLDSHLGGLLAEASLEEDFTGKAGQSTVLRLAGLGSKRVGLIGLGQSASTTLAYRSLGEAVAAAAKAARASNVAIVLASPEGLSAESKLNTASAIASGTVLGTYEDIRFKSESKKPPSALKSVDILGLGTGPELEKKLKYAEDVCSAIIFGKELVNSPANVLTPGVLAEEASKIASMYSDVLSATILNVDQCKELKMGSYLGVAAASANPPHFIHLCYKPSSGPVKAKLALVGKGLTFDSGGYNIKTGPGCSIEFMKFDMGDAEGRLTLADALVYACNQGVEKIVDLATLTGACVVALGPSIAGVFTPSDDLAKEVLAASEVAGEKLWRMPLEESYWESMKSGVADMVNTGGRQGGAITAALFLKQFVSEKVQWMHIDMAGPVASDKKRLATGFGISTLVEWVMKNSS
ncbi:hypothetical protein TEA_025275 [Camellia sinensis var. sinensis]|uniref:Cytosol aminopeptidase domain-containing protein n=1 Tax=Camellia sinensis var. sinensis TaxID=542762 RepID=A0A4S4EDV9_CAMSN|nr:hypothetical protein TEA_025275 [Camellia sinensis var. sinensis]